MQRRSELQFKLYIGRRRYGISGRQYFFYVNSGKRCIVYRDIGGEKYLEKEERRRLQRLWLQWLWQGVSQ